MFFDNIKDEVQILKEMQELAQMDVERTMGSFVWDALAPAANEMAQQYIEIRDNLSKAFVQTSYEEFLDMKAEEFGLTRKEGNQAIAKVKFTGIEGTVIPSSFLVQTESGLTYKTMIEATISDLGYVETHVEAEENGSKYNVAADTIIKIPVTLVGLTTVTNPQEATGGAGLETDEALAQRVLIKAKSPATSGNANHYRIWAMSNDSVGDAKVYPLHEGPGTVKVVIIDINKEPANEMIVKEVYDYIEVERPIGATVTVESAKELEVNIVATVEAEQPGNTESIRLEFGKQLDAYIKSTALKSDYISLAKVGAILLSIEGVNDYSVLKINNNSSNLPIAEDYVAVLGGVTINE